MTANITIPADVLRDLLTGASVAASRDATLPALNAVHLAWTAGDTATLTATATDRYRVHQGSTTAAGTDHAGTFVLALADALAVVKLLPKPARGRTAIDVTITADETVFIVECGHDLRRCTRPDVDYPRLDTLWPAPDKEATPTASISFDPNFVAGLAKIPVGGYPAWRFTFYTRDKATTGGEPRRSPALAAPLAPHPRIEWRALVMPSVEAIA